MVKPPQGSFSWIRGDYVKRVGHNRGVLKKNDVVVWVGSSIDDEENCDVKQRQLSTYDEVEILDEKTFHRDGRMVRMYKIKPPKGEYRWLPGRSVTSMNNVARRRQNQDPFTLHSHAQQSYDDPPENKDSTAGFSKRQKDSNVHKKGLVERKVVQTPDADAVRHSGPDLARLEADRRELKQLDAWFRKIIQQNTGEWDFDLLERDYLGLQASVAVPALASQIDMRLDALKRYQRIKDEYNEFRRLTSETSRREAELLTMQRNQQAPVLAQRLPDKPQPPIMPIPEPIPEPRQAGPRLWQTNPGTPPAARSIVHQVRRFDGAGIIQHTASTSPGTPRHVLLAPNGRILAYLQAEGGMNLDQFVKRSMGITGNRTYRNDLQTDFIVVRGLTPFRLQP